MTTPEFDVSPVGRSFAPPAADLCIFPLFLFAGKRFTPVARPALPGSGMSAAPDAGRCHRRRLSLLVGAKTYEADRKTEAGKGGGRAGRQPQLLRGERRRLLRRLWQRRGRGGLPAPPRLLATASVARSHSSYRRGACPTLSQTPSCGNPRRSRMEISPNPPRLARGRTARG